MAIGTPVALGSNRASSGSTTLVITTSAASAAGNMIAVAAAVQDDSVVDITSVTDSAGNTYSAGTQYGTVPLIRFFYSPNATALGSGGTITITYSGTGGGKYAAAGSVSGIATTSPLDKQGPGANPDGTSISVSTGTLSQADEIVFGYLAVFNGPTANAGSGFTALVNNTGANTIQLAYQIVSATTSVTYNPSWSGTASPAGNVITFKAAAGGTDVALTGNAATGAVGTLAPTASRSLSGNSGTGQVGSLTSSSVQSVALTGNEATGAVGTLTPSTAFSVALTGVSGTGAVGSLTSSSVQSVAITGNSATGAVGSLAKTFTIALTGVSGTGSPGTLTPLTGTVVALTGVYGTGSVGTLTPIASARLRFIPTILNTDQLQAQLNDIFATIYSGFPGYGDTLPDPNGQVDGRLFTLTTTNKLYQLQAGFWIALT